MARARRPLIRSSVPPASDLYSLHANTGWHRCACGQRVQPAAKTPATCGEILRRARFHIGLAAAKREAAAEGAETLNWLGIGSFPISLHSFAAQCGICLQPAALSTQRMPFRAGREHWCWAPCRTASGRLLAHERPNQTTRIEADRCGNREKLEHIEAPIPSLVFRDVGRRLA